MSFDFFDRVQDVVKETVDKTVENSKNEIELKNLNISKEEIDLAQKLNAIEEFCVDRFEGNIENKENSNMINISRNDLPNDVHEGDIIKKINGKYIVDKQRTMDEKNRIKDKMDNLWK